MEKKQLEKKKRFAFASMLLDTSQIVFLHLILWRRNVNQSRIAQQDHRKMNPMPIKGLSD